MNFRRSVINAELWRPEVARPGNFVSHFCIFLKTAHYGKIFKILFRKFSPPHWSTLLCWNVVKFCRREIGEIVCYFTIFAFSQTVATARIATKICQGQPQHFAVALFQILSKSFYFRRSYSRTREGHHIVFTWFVSNTFEENNNVLRMLMHKGRGTFSLLLFQNTFFILSSFYHHHFQEGTWWSVKTSRTN